MVEEERIHEWIEEKLEQGVSEERIKKSLENTGHDPSLVDKAKDPFHDGSEQDPTQKTDADQSNEELKQMDQGPQSQNNQGDQPQPLKGTPKDFSSNEEKNGDSSGLMDKISVPDISFPSVSVSKPDMNVSENINVSKKHLKYAVAALVILVVIGGGILGLSQMKTGNLAERATESINTATSENTNGAQQSSGGGSCPDVGVRIERAWISNGQTYADVRVNRGSAEVVLEVYSSGSVAGSTTDTFSGDSQMQVDATGDKAVFRPAGCSEFSDSISLG